MSKENAQTLGVYDGGVDTYREGTVQKTSGYQKEWIDGLLDGLPMSASILEIGSAFGRDADYMTSKGYAPHLTDGSKGFVAYLREHGYKAEVLDIVNQQPQGTYDLVLACAVFLHFTARDFERAVLNVKESLNENGRFALTLKNGDGEEWTDAKMNEPRYFRYWRKEGVEQVFGSLGLKSLDIHLSPDEKWLHVTVRKGASS